MFTGLVTDKGTIAAISDQPDLRRIRIHSAYDADGIALGASIACNGPCLTVVDKGHREGGSWFDVDIAAETLARTNAGAWQVGDALNLERSLKIGDELGGHIVTGHVDGIATIVTREEVTGAGEWGPTARFTIEAPAQLARFIAEKGSICLDGTSLTVNSVDGNRFSVLLIPHTLAVTTWGERKAGDTLNIEIDLMARYAARLIEARD
ncbi:MAG: riboflavin synthase [Salinarimonas sp.]